MSYIAWHLIHIYIYTYILQASTQCDVSCLVVEIAAELERVWEESWLDSWILYLDRLHHQQEQREPAIQLSHAVLFQSHYSVIDC